MKPRQFDLNFSYKNGVIESRGDFEISKKEVIHVREVSKEFDSACNGLVEALVKANEICRSAFSIASRNGNMTNWDGFQMQLRKGLDEQHKALIAFRKANGEL